MEKSDTCHISHSIPTKVVGKEVLGLLVEVTVLRSHLCEGEVCEEG